jgi:hypothetical protein
MDKAKHIIVICYLMKKHLYLYEGIEAICDYYYYHMMLRVNTFLYKTEAARSLHKNGFNYFILSPFSCSNS